jgi:HSP20 family protein
MSAIAGPEPRPRAWSRQTIRPAPNFSMFRIGNTLDNAIVKILGFAVSYGDRAAAPETTISQEVYVLTLVRRSSPIGELVSLRQAMDRLFEDSFIRPRSWAFGAFDSYSFPVDVTNGTEAVTVEASLPGFKPEDVDITIENSVLSINAETRSERREGEGESLVQEIRRGRVSRTIALPTGIEPDKATASFEDGVLKLQIPKAEAVKPRQIRISPTTHASTDSSNAKKGLATGEPTAETARAGA